MTGVLLRRPRSRAERRAADRAVEKPTVDADEAADPAPHVGRVRSWTPYILAAIFVIPYTAIALLRLRRHEPMSLDLALFEQAVKAYANLHAPIANLKGSNYNLLGDHFHPMLALLAPGYRIFPHPSTLLVSQAVLFAASIIPVTRTAMRVTGKASGTCIGIAYGLSFGIQSAVNFDFHEICLAMPFIALSLEAFLLRRYWVSALWILPLLGVKEDLGLTVAALGACLFIRRQRWLGAGMTALGLAACGLITFVVLPAINPRGDYEYLDENHRPHGSPLSILEGVFHGQAKAWTVIYLLAISGMLILRSPLGLMLVPTLAWRFTSQVENHWGNGYHYDSILMVIAFMAVLDAVPKLERSRWAWMRAYALRVPAVLLTVAILLIKQFPFSAFYDPATYRVNEVREAAAAAAMAQIPPNTNVESDQSLATYLVRNHTVYWIGDTGKLIPDYIVIDLDGNPDPPRDLTEWGDGVHPGSKFGLIYMNQGYVVFRHVT